MKGILVDSSAFALGRIYDFTVRPVAMVAVFSLATAHCLICCCCRLGFVYSHSSARRDTSLVGAVVTIAVIKPTYETLKKCVQDLKFVPRPQARKALRALKSLVKLQALVRGYLVRKQAATTLHRLQALMRLQASSNALKNLSSRRSIEQVRIPSRRAS